MRVHCVGVGSIGSLVAFHLRRCNPVPNHDFTLLLRKQASRRPHITPSVSSQHIYVESDGIRRRISGFDVETLDSTKDALLQVPIGQGSSGARPDHLSPLPSFKSIKPAENLPVIQSLIVTNKAGTTLLALQALRSRLNASSTVVLLQNGMGVYEHAVDRLFPDPDTRPNFIIASTTHGAWSKRPQDIVHAGVGQIQFALVPDPLQRRDFDEPLLSGRHRSLVSSPTYNPTLDPAIDTISTASSRDEDPKFYSLAETTRTLLRAKNELGVSWVPMADMEVVVRKKLAINACIGPITALIDCPNGALYGNTSAHRLIGNICREAADVFARQAEEEAAHGRPVSPLWSTSLSKKALEESVNFVIRSTSRNFSSMLMDVRNGKITEIEYINGYLSRMGGMLGVPVPTNQMLLEVIRMKRSIPSAKYATH